jgi:hypothetical protein
MTFILASEQFLRTKQGVTQQNKQQTRARKHTNMPAHRIASTLINSQSQANQQPTNHLINGVRLECEELVQDFATDVVTTIDRRARDVVGVHANLRLQIVAWLVGPHVEQLVLEVLLAFVDGCCDTTSHCSVTGDTKKKSIAQRRHLS